ncbi:hypothetical protein LTR65_008869 [Meristemomyces frigidus]
MGKSVVLIEREDRLGGHVNTYVDPLTHKTFDYGVVIFGNSSIVTDYFGYFNIPLTPWGGTGASDAVFADFANAAVVSGQSLGQGNLTAALLAYEDQLARYPYLENGFGLPTPVPSDLLLSWAGFMEKYDLGAMAYTLFVFNQGAGNILAETALYILKYFSATTVQAFFTGSFLTTAHSDNQELYNAALAKLGTSALLSSNVTRIIRHRDHAEVVVSTPTGIKCIEASKLLIAIPPKLSNLGFMDLDDEERGIFSQFNNSYYWAAVLKDSGIPYNTSLANVDPSAPYAIPQMPGVYGFGTVPGFSGLHTVYYGSPYPQSDAEVRANILDTTARLVESLGYGTVNGTMAELVGFSAHNPYELTVSTDAIEDGFYGKLESLQGSKRTWWTGAAFQTEDSSAIWKFTEQRVLPSL